MIFQRIMMMLFVMASGCIPLITNVCKCPGIQGLAVDSVGKPLSETEIHVIRPIFSHDIAVHTTNTDTLGIYKAAKKQMIGIVFAMPGVKMGNLFVERKGVYGLRSLHSRIMISSTGHSPCFVKATKAQILEVAIEHRKQVEENKSTLPKFPNASAKQQEHWRRLITAIALGQVYVEQNKLDKLDSLISDLELDLRTYHYCSDLHRETDFQTYETCKNKIKTLEKKLDTLVKIVRKNK